MFKIVQDAESNQLLGFLLDGDNFCINIRYVQEIIYIPAISKVPNVANYVEGAIDLRGKIVRIINLRKWLELPWQYFTEKSRILIINIKEGIFGLLVDEVAEVINIEKSMVKDLPELFQQEENLNYVKSMIVKQNEIFLEINPNQIRA